MTAPARDGSPPTTAGRFDGMIAGVGTASGLRVVVGMWTATPFGPIADAMIETATGRRILVAPSEAVGRFVADTYGFDEIRVEPTLVRTSRSHRWFESESLHLRMQIGRRTGTGWLLAAVPRRLARTRTWCRLIDPLARLLRPGVRTVGSAGSGRREFYCALDEHLIAASGITWEGRELGGLRPVEPPVRFGFASTPRRPSLVRVTTLIDA